MRNTKYIWWFLSISHKKDWNLSLVWLSAWYEKKSSSNLMSDWVHQKRCLIHHRTQRMCILCQLELTVYIGIIIWLLQKNSKDTHYWTWKWYISLVYYQGSSLCIKGTMISQIKHEFDGKDTAKCELCHGSERMNDLKLHCTSEHHLNLCPVIGTNGFWKRSQWSTCQKDMETNTQWKYIIHTVSTLQWSPLIRN